MMSRVQRTAVIDMGSNSFRLVVYGWEPGRYWQHVDEIREAVRVSAGMGESGAIKGSRVKRAVQTAVVFASFCRHSGIDDVRPVATSAIRDATNQAELLEQMRDHAGLDVRVLSTEDETRYGYLAIANTTTVENGWGLDMGGGSLQLMRIEDRRLRESGSWPLGAVRVSEEFLPDDKPSSKQIKALRKHVAKAVGGATGCRTATAAPFAGIGGTVRNLAAAAQKRAGHPDTGGVQGFRLTRDALEELIEELSGMPPAKRGGVPGIKPDRGDVILGGAVVLGALMDHGGFDRGRGDRRRACARASSSSASSTTATRRWSRTCGARRCINLANRYQDDLEHPRRTSPSCRCSCSTGCAWRAWPTCSDPTSASCCGPPACCTTSAPPSTTTTTTSTRAT